MISYAGALFLYGEIETPFAIFVLSTSIICIIHDKIYNKNLNITHKTDDIPLELYIILTLLVTKFMFIILKQSEDILLWDNLLKEIDYMSITRHKMWRLIDPIIFVSSVNYIGL